LGDLIAVIRELTQPSLTSTQRRLFRACEFVRSKPLQQLRISHFACCGYAADNSARRVTESRNCIQAERRRRPVDRRKPRAGAQPSDRAEMIERRKTPKAQT
jgi:hypothetical protein